MEKLLPRDIALNIFYRLPIQSVLDCKLVCKAWRNILSGPSFARQNLLYRLHDHDCGFVLLTVNFFGNLSLCYHEYAAGNQFVDMKKISHPSDNGSFFRTVIGSCNDLICCAVNCNGDPTFVCNSITKEYYCLPELNAESQLFVRSGFGYNHSTDEYKVVRIFEKGRVQVSTLDGTSDGWVDKDEVISYEFRTQKGIFANGETFWLCNDYRTIVAFNVADEEFREFVNLPPSIKAEDAVVVALVALDRCLCVVEWLYVLRKMKYRDYQESTS
ncbi:putative F-box protein At3g16210 [Papaver somniferum]|uniref:putative F-box protein At3g16210 n=1 Tax=Papaver somniferum TaxID=3469 RepID=UPI000E7033D6|nr:putative F-box protein At3g16210 [Papaver somniferum]